MFATIAAASGKDDILNIYHVDGEPLTSVTTFIV